jgi:hypothetical protein
VLPPLDAGELEHLRRKLAGVPAHEPVVRLGGDVERHA